MRCPRCQHENRQQAKFCGACGTPLTANPSGPPAPSYAEITSALSEALEQQTATAEILRVISSSPTDVQPVFAAVLTSAARLCDALDASIFQVDGDGLRLVAHEGPIPSHPVGEFPLIRGMTVGRAVLDRRTIHVPDVQAEVDEYPEASAFARSYGFRTTLSVPLLRGTEAIGAIGIRRTEVRPFTDRQIELLETFAAQAVIAIENVRLFNETKEALEQQTATGEILRVISSSPTDVQPVFDAIVESAVRLCGAHVGVFRFDGDLIHLCRSAQLAAEDRWRCGAVFPSAATPWRTGGAATADDPRRGHPGRRGRVPGDRVPHDARGAFEPDLLGTPMLREGAPIGVIYVSAGRAGPFTANRSSWSRPLPTRPSSPSRTCGCSN